MDDHEHIKFARLMLAALISRVRNFQGGDKFITYGNLAREVGYPEPHTYNIFSNRIGHTLGVMGHLLDGIVVGGLCPPFIQAMVVSKSQKVPSDGLREFDSNYPSLSIQKKRDYANAEYEKIFEFGSRWDEIADMLELTLLPRETPPSPPPGGLYNPYGSEGSPEHQALRDYIAEHPEVVGADSGLEGLKEFPLKSGDKIDVVFESDTHIWGVEVKSRRSGTDDLERGIYQCVKYKAVLEAESKASNITRLIQCCLVIEPQLPSALKKVARKLGVEVDDSFSFPPD